MRRQQMFRRCPLTEAKYYLLTKFLIKIASPRYNRLKGPHDVAVPYREHNECLDTNFLTVVC